MLSPVFAPETWLSAQAPIRTPLERDDGRHRRSPRLRKSVSSRNHQTPRLPNAQRTQNMYTHLDDEVCNRAEGGRAVTLPPNRSDLHAPTSARSDATVRKLRLEIVFERPPVIENAVPSTYHGYWFFSFTSMLPCKIQKTKHLTGAHGHPKNRAFAAPGETRGCMPLPSPLPLYVKDS
jgi:hypothetical protein